MNNLIDFFALLYKFLYVIIFFIDCNLLNKGSK